eukprot:scaffold9862_cov118-Isochrysis_galbana.AAC.5
MKDERDGMGTKNKGKGKGKGKGSGRDRVVWVVGPAFQSRSREWPTAHSPSPPHALSAHDRRRPTNAPHTHSSTTTITLPLPEPRPRLHRQGRRRPSPSPSPPSHSLNLIGLIAHY